MALPLPSLYQIASAKPNMIWFAPVPPITDWCMLSVSCSGLPAISYTAHRPAARCRSPWKVAPSPVLRSLNPAACGLPLLPVPMVTSTQGNRSCEHPLGFHLVILLLLQSYCCHIW